MYLLTSQKHPFINQSRKYIRTIFVYNKKDVHSWFCPRTLPTPLFFITKFTKEIWEWLGYSMPGGKCWRWGGGKITSLRSPRVVPFELGKISVVSLSWTHTFSQYYCLGLLDYLFHRSTTWRLTRKPTPLYSGGVAEMGPYWWILLFASQAILWQHAS